MLQLTIIVGVINFSFYCRIGLARISNLECHMGLSGRACALLLWSIVNRIFSFPTLLIVLSGLLISLSLYNTKC